MERKLVSTKTYKIVVKEYDNGEFTMKRENKGFTPMEVLGVLDFSKNHARNLLCQGETEYKPNVE